MTGNKTTEKLENFKLHMMRALYSMYGTFDYEGAMEQTRKAIEAYMKICIYKYWGETNGYKYIMGQKELNMSDTGKNYHRSYKELTKAVEVIEQHEPNIAVPGTAQKISDLGRILNPPSHDDDEGVTQEEWRTQAETACASMKDIINDTYRLAAEGEWPAELQKAYYDHLIDPSLKNTIHEADKHDLLETLDNFHKYNRYVLVTPGRMTQVTIGMMRAIDSVPWSFVIDFDPSSKREGGLYYALQPEIANHSHIINYDRERHGDRVMTGNNGYVNWVMAYGESGLSKTKVENHRDWVAKSYHKFIGSLFKEYCRTSPMTLYVVILDLDFNYVKHIVTALDNIEELENSRVNLCFLTSNPAKKAKIRSLNSEGYGFNISQYDFSAADFLGILSTSAPDEQRRCACPIKARIEDRDTTIDISSHQAYYISQGIEPVHMNIDLSDKPDEEPADNVPESYKGHTIRWHELSAGVDVERNLYRSLRAEIVKQLTQSPDATLINLTHKPGAGGTTIARHLAYELKNEHPVVMLTSYKPSQTFQALDSLYQRVNRPMLVVAETSLTGNIGELVERCKSSKRPIIFLAVERALVSSRRRGPNNTLALKEQMVDFDERNRFMEKVRQYNRKEYDELKANGRSDLEVIDFSMAICENMYEKEKIRTYVKTYIDALSGNDNLYNFVTYVAMIYKYSQKTVNADIFWRLFSYGDQAVGMHTYMDSLPELREPLEKVLIEMSQDNVPNNEWRPRYSVFADCIVEVCLAGDRRDTWRSRLPMFAENLIDAVKESNPSLTDDVQKMLSAVFLSRGKDDLLGTEEQWEANVNNTKFSQLIADIGDMGEQKNVLMKLANAFPDESHFWGHLARFCYEKANTPKEFEEAMDYVERALELGGDTDFVILHVSGMCRRRIIEYHSRTNSNTFSFDNLRELTMEAREAFAMSRDMEKDNAHAYISDIQLMAEVIEYGKKQSEYTKYKSFLFDPDNEWYLNLYEEMIHLVEQSKVLLSHQKLTNKEQYSHTRTFLIKSESNMYDMIGDHDKGLAFLRSKIANADKDEQTRLNLIYVGMLLRTLYNPKKEETIDVAWRKLSSVQCEDIRTRLEQAIRHRGGNIYAMRRWIEMARFSCLDIDLETVKSILRQLFQTSEDAPMLHYESAFYSFVANAIQVMQEGDQLNESKIKEVERWKDECNKLPDNVSSGLRCNEWLCSLDGFKGIAHIIDREKTSLQNFEGTIYRITSPRQGDIQMDCGLTAFFSPRDGRFIQKHDESKRVTFHIGFRYNGLYAVDVKVVGSDEMISYTSDETTAPDVSATEPEKSATESTFIVEEPVEVAPLPAQPLPEEESPDLFRLESETIKAKPKILGKIDLSNMPTKKDRWKKKTNLDNN